MGDHARRRRQLAGWLALSALCVASGWTGSSTGASSGSSIAPNRERDRTRVLERYGKLPLSFEANRGQTDGGARFISRGHGYTLFLTGTEALLALDAQPHNSLLRMRLAGADQRASVRGHDELPGKSNYFIGNDARKWRTEVPSYARVEYQDVYPGIDLVYYGNQGQLEYDFVVQPGADPTSIRLDVEAERTSRLAISANGDLAISLGDGDVQLHKPVVYQPRGSHRRGNHSSFSGEDRELVSASYVLLADNRVGFEVRGFDRSRPLVIDPTLSYSTYLGSNQGLAIAVDSSGNAYVTGNTTSAAFPGVGSLPAPNTALQGTEDAFVAKLNPTGTALVYATYLGGSNVDQGVAIAVDSSGNAYVTGTTQSADFPTSNAYQSSLKGTISAYVTKLNASGSALLYSTYLGGTGSDQGRGIGLDSLGRVYVTGGAQSADFPITAGAYQAVLGGHQNAFVTKLDTTQPGSSSLVYSTYLGGNNYDAGVGIGADSSGNVIVAGETSSTNFPTLNPYQASLGAALENPFITKLNSTASALVYSTYLGGNYFNGPPLQNAYNLTEALAVDPSGNAYVAGYTDAYDFPLNHASQGTCQPSCTWDGFVAKFNPTGANVYSTYFGGSLWQGAGIFGNQVFGLAADAAGNAYLTGFTEAGNFPLLSPLQSLLGGGLTATFQDNAFVAELNATGQLAFSTYLGGTCSDKGTGIAVDGSGNIYVAGATCSKDFPVIAGGLTTTLGSNGSFVAKISPLNTPSMSVTPSSLTFPIKPMGVTSAARAISVRDVSTSALSVSSIAITGANSGDFSETDTCSSPVAAGTDCGIAVIFTPSVIGAETATLTVTASGATGSPAVVALNGTGASDGVVSLPATSANLGPVVVGNPSQPEPFTLTNTGTGPLGNINVSVSAGWTLTTNTCPATLAAGANCTFSVQVTPGAAGKVAGVITITNDSAAGTQTINISATGVVSTPPLSYAFTTLNFPGASATAALGLNNAGHIVGTYQDASGVTHGFTGSAGTFATLDVPSSTLTQVWGVNASNESVGTYKDSGGVFHGFSFSGGVFKTINYPGSSFTTTTGVDPLAVISSEPTHSPAVRVEPRAATRPPVAPSSARAIFRVPRRPRCPRSTLPARSWESTPVPCSARMTAGFSTAAARTPRSTSRAPRRQTRR